MLKWPILTTIDISNPKPAGSEVEPIPPREDHREDSPTMLQQFRNEYLKAYASVDPTGADITRNSHIFEAINIAATDWLCMGQILFKLANYVFGDSDYLTAHDLHLALEAGSWSADYIADAERFTPPSVESKQLWEMQHNSIPVSSCGDRSS